MASVMAPWRMRRVIARSHGMDFPDGLGKESALTKAPVPRHTVQQRQIEASGKETPPRVRLLLRRKGILAITVLDTLNAKLPSLFPSPGGTGRNSHHSEESVT